MNFHNRAMVLCGRAAIISVVVVLAVALAIFASLPLAVSSGDWCATASSATSAPGPAIRFRSANAPSLEFWPTPTITLDNVEIRPSTFAGGDPILRADRIVAKFQPVLGGAGGAKLLPVQADPAFLQCRGVSGLHLQLDFHLRRPCARHRSCRRPRSRRPGRHNPAGSRQHSGVGRARHRDHRRRYGHMDPRSRRAGREAHRHQRHAGMDGADGRGPGQSGGDSFAASK